MISNINTNTSYSNNSIQSNSNKESKNIYKQIAKDYDITNATFDEFVDIQHKLYKAGEISFDQMASTTFDYSKCKFGRKDIALSRPMLEGKHNWINYFNKMKNRCINAGANDAVKIKSNAINILQKIEAYEY